MELKQRELSSISKQELAGTLLRNQSIKEMRADGFSYGKIARVLGISRQRVHQITSGYQINLDHLHNGYGFAHIHKAILERDGKCRKCSKTQNLIVHHINNNDRDNRYDNLVTLCNDCHLYLHIPTKAV